MQKVNKLPFIHSLCPSKSTILAIGWLHTIRLLKRSAKSDKGSFLWLAICNKNLLSFKNVFLYLELMGLLIRSNDIDLYALHYVYMPRINTALTQFVDTFNNHGLSSEHGLTPHQLWISGILQHHSSNYSGVRGIIDNSSPEDLNMYGDDPNAPTPQGDDLSGVEVPQNSLHVPLHVITVLHETFPPGVEDSNQGMNIYFQVRQFLMCYFASGF